MSTYLENYLESVSTLPAELQRNFGLIRELDEKSANLMVDVEQYISDFQRSSHQKFTDAYPEDTVKRLRTNLQTCMELGDEKVALAVQTYELVDKHIRRLDQDLKKFEHELSQQQKQHSQAANNLSKAKGKRPLAEKTKSPRPPSTRSQAPVAAGFDMPIDPNEPTYCTCGRVSFGQMIGCDNPDCPIEWFHFECVGLTGAVKGKWYCPVCTAKRQKEKSLKGGAPSAPSTPAPKQ